MKFSGQFFRLTTLDVNTHYTVQKAFGHTEIYTFLQTRTHTEGTFNFHLGF